MDLIIILNIRVVLKIKFLKLTLDKEGKKVGNTADKLIDSHLPK